jgi:hypothetical protein
MGDETVVSGEVVSAEESLEERERRAGELDQDIRKVIGSIHRSWAVLAGLFFEFHGRRGWEPLGFDTLNGWLAEPDVGVGRNEFFKLVRIYRELVVGRELPIEELARLDRSKVATVLPAIERGEQSLDQALADCEALGFRDLQAEYGGRAPEEGPLRVSCPTCGSRVDPDRIDEAA